MDGAELRTRRLALGISQETLAARMGTTQVAISDWERGVIRMQHPRLIDAFMRLEEIRAHARARRARFDARARASRGPGIGRGQRPNLF